MITNLRRSVVCSLLLLQCACSTVPDTGKIPTKNTAHQIHFIYREWHTSILLPAEAVLAHSRFLRASAQGKQYIRIGWGDGDYFTGKSKSLGTATKALFISQYSALQVLGYGVAPFADIPAETRVPLALTRQGMRKLVRYIDDSFVLDVSLRPIPLPAYGEGVGDFYQAHGRYGLFSNCNTWSGRALQAAGLPVRSRLQLTAQSVFEQARAISEYQQQVGSTQNPE